MIKSVGQSIGSPVDLAKLREGGKAKAASATTDGTESLSASGASTAVSSMAAQGAPVDMERVSAIKDAIKSGNYPVDADAIAERMIALDLGDRG